MGKEAKVGLSIIGMLMIVLAGVVTMRLTQREPSLADAEPIIAGENIPAPSLATEPGSSSLLNKMSSPTTKSESASVWDRAPEPTRVVTTSNDPTPSATNDRYAAPVSDRYASGNDRYNTTRDEMTVPATGSDANDPFESKTIQTAATSEATDAAPATSPATPAMPAELESSSGPTMPTLTVGTSNPTAATPPASRYEPQPNDRYATNPTTTPSTPSTSPSTTANDPYAFPSASPNRAFDAPTTPSSSTIDAAPAALTPPASLPSSPASSDRTASTSSALTSPSTMPGPSSYPDHSTELSTATSRSQPSATPAAPTPSATPAVQNAYVVGPRENNFWTISEKAYGTGAYFEALAALNRGRVSDPSHLPPNTVVSVPPVEELQRQFPSLCPTPSSTSLTSTTTTSVPSTPSANTPNLPEGGRLYQVQPGDTLFDIARRELGKAGRWAEIYDLNRQSIGQSFDKLAPGTQLVLPGDSAPIATQPGSLTAPSFQR